MNVVALVGRLTKDPDISYTRDGSSIAKFTAAVDRRFKSDGQPTADFISCVSFGKTAEFVEKWFHKGDPIALSGRIQTGSYTNKEGNKVYTTDVIAEQVNFVPGRSEQPAAAPAPKAESNVGEGFMAIPEGADEDLGLPFA